MKAKNDIEVLIGGSKYTLCGYESADYLQKVATHINAKYDEVNKSMSMKMMDNGAKSVLIQINLADDYFKLKQRIEEMNREKEETERSLFEIKHDLVAAKDKIEKISEKNRDLAFKLDEEKKKLFETTAQLDTEKARCSELEDNINSLINGEV